MEPIRLTIPIEPKAQQRFRVRVIKVGFDHVPATYKSVTQKRYEKEMMLHIKRLYRGKPIESPVTVQITAYLPIPASMLKRDKILALNGDLPHSHKPDCDNLLKNALDIMTGLVYHDDNAVVSAHITKRYSDAPRWEITLEGV
jgi:Holliday junction resolvase RusA-like endonuclease